MQKMARRNKYNAKKIKIDGHTFDSKREAERYCELKLFFKAGLIRNLELQPRFLLQDEFFDKNEVKHKKIEYVADFLYIDNNGKAIVEDVKGVLTDVYKIKKKMFLKIYDDQYEFREIR
ncbi:DUF1064 domain-containing protein [Finegoldia magna]|uniref:DUF1064 domain-containing protein n=1 Tax=Finegoldia magna TaxID=1260 RepID=UPI00291616AD|nr:DUF1064 domain-containing protein [Finegoldia magna]